MTDSKPYYQLWQSERYGNVLEETVATETSEIDLEDQARKVEQHAEQQLFEHL